MALKPCRECKKKVSTEAAACPSCGVPNPTQKIKKIEKPKPIGILETYARCEKNFCSKRYEIIIITKVSIGTKVCKQCGNEITEVDYEDAIRDLELKNKKIKLRAEEKITKKVPIDDGFIFGFWDGREGLAKTFWLFFIGGSMFLNLFALIALSSSEPGLVIFIQLFQFVWMILTTIGVFKAADIYKEEKIRSDQTYAYATAAKVGTVILILSAIGNAI